MNSFLCVLFLVFADKVFSETTPDIQISLASGIGKIGGATIKAVTDKQVLATLEADALAYIAGRAAGGTVIQFASAAKYPVFYQFTVKVDNTLRILQATPNDDNEIKAAGVVSDFYYSTTECTYSGDLEDNYNFAELHIQQLFTKLPVTCSFLAAVQTSEKTIVYTRHIFKGTSESTPSLNGSYVHYAVFIK